VQPAKSEFGFINARKPPGPTSTSFGSRVRHALGGVSLGHWGTLDPGAEGVLVLAIGHATKLLPLLGSGRKRYEFDLVLGRATDTGDASGATVAESAVPEDWADRLPSALASFVGTISQIPPMYSAVKVDGQPLYKSARKGVSVHRAPREVVVYALDILGRSDLGARLNVECDAGTYVRTLCEDIGKRLGAPAHMGSLLRTSAGPFTLDNAVAEDALLADPRAHVIDPLDVLPQPRVELDAARAQRFAHGNALEHPAAVTYGDVLVIVDGRLAGTALATQSGDGVRLQPTRVFYP
jgi:tRNA pseudouridine55 synthase